ncbi:DUF2933 domain-containing protein [Acinetobacter sp. NS-4]|uniref:DUF2933 domain-containing protein n=1 Tax=Acinetobacter sp. NS-4 TaxID=3127956 RepID=UPI00307EBA3B
MKQQHQGHESPPRFWSSRYAIGFLVIAGVAAYFLLTEHLAHTIAALPYLLLLVCPLMHVFMHGGHHHHGKKPDTRNQTESDQPGDKP